MARKVFFSFHYAHDSWRVGQVRNSNIITTYEKPPFLDKAGWETVQAKGSDSIKRWIDTQLQGTSVTIVLIGNQTSKREWVQYEIDESWKRGNGMFGIYIHNIKNSMGWADAKGDNPFAGIKVPLGPITLDLGNYVRCYDWQYEDGRNNIGNWIEAAAKQRGK